MRRYLLIFIIILIIFPGMVFGKMAKDKNSNSKSHLKNIHIRDLKKPIKGELVQTTLEVVEDLMKAKRFKFEKQCGKETGFKLKNKEIKADSIGHKHIRLIQYYKGLPVIGGELIVHINKKDVIYRINGMYLSDIDVLVDPTIDGESALEVGFDELYEKPDLRVTKKPSLVIYDSHLAWHFVMSHEGPEPGRWWYYVDAHTGELITRYNNIQYICKEPTSDGSYESITGERLYGEGNGYVEITGWYDNTNGNYYLYNDCNHWGPCDANTNYNWGVFDKRTDCWALRTEPNWGGSDPAAISAANNIALTQEWVTNQLGWCSFDNQCTLGRANIHHSMGYEGGLWDGEDFYFTDAYSYIFIRSYTSLDIVAHEYGHAVTQYTSGLVANKEFESYALNESYSDIMAVAVEFWAQPDGRSAYGAYGGFTRGYSDWLIGEDAGLSVKRDLRKPKRIGDASYYEGNFWDDDGDPYQNAGVQNFAFYLLAEGDPNGGTNDEHPYDPITGIGIENAAKVAMRANWYYLTSYADYQLSRIAWVASAEDLDDPNIPLETVKAVWDAVGVFVPNDLTLQNVTLLSGTYEAYNSIVADPNVTIAGGAVVTFIAADSISAGSNFTIEENADVTFEAATITADDNFIIKSGAKVVFDATGGWIVAGPNFTIESGAEVVFRASSYIKILNEFLAHEGCIFDATVQ